jgi:polar amino acid transport system substrate-binding protein
MSRPRFVAKAVLSGSLVLVFLLCVGCQTSNMTGTSKPDLLRIGFAIEAPYAFLKPGGEISGQAPEIAKRIARDLGYQKIQWRQLEFHQLLDELEAGEIDVVAAGMFITPERSKRVSFSEPTAHVSEAFLVAKGNPHGLQSYRQLLEQPECKVAVIAGAVEETIFRQLGLSARQLLLVPDALTGRVAVEAGQADCLALSAPTIRWMALREQLGKTEMVEPRNDAANEFPANYGYVAFAFRREADSLREAWNRVQRRFVSTAEHQLLVAEFGFTAVELSGLIPN